MILDTNVFIDCQHGRFDLKRLPSNEGRYFLTYIVLSEFLVGQYRTDDVLTATAINNYAASLRRTIPCIPFNYKVAEVHAELFNTAKEKNIGAHDVIIAATAIAYNFKIVTRNIKDFEVFPELGIINTSNL